MNFLARLHPFLILAVLLVGIFVTGLFWEAPFQGNEQGLPRLVGRVWDVAFLPVRFALDQLSGVGVDPTRTVTILVLAGYAAVFLLLDFIVTKLGRR